MNFLHQRKHYGIAGVVDTYNCAIPPADGLQARSAHSILQRQNKSLEPRKPQNNDNEIKQQLAKAKSLKIREHPQSENLRTTGTTK
jgi:hypothetical protein